MSLHLITPPAEAIVSIPSWWRIFAAPPRTDTKFAALPAATKLIAPGRS
jgi:hypothetical protein